KDFPGFAPQFEKLFKLIRQKAECYGYEGSPWNALAPDYERGMTAETVKTIFAPLRDGTIRILDKIRGAEPVDTEFLNQKWNLDAQREFGLRVARDIGYDMAAGRLDVAAHPFCTNFDIDDVRITTRYNE